MWRAILAFSVVIDRVKRLPFNPKLPDILMMADNSLLSNRDWLINSSLTFTVKLIFLLTSIGSSILAPHSPHCEKHRHFPNEENPMKRSEEHTSELQS